MSKTVILTMDELRQFGESIALTAVEETLKEVDIITDTIGSTQAKKLYGRANLERWVNNGDLKLGRDYFKRGTKNSRITYSRKRLRELNLTVNLNE